MDTVLHASRSGTPNWTMCGWIARAWRETEAPVLLKQLLPSLLLSLPPSSLPPPFPSLHHSSPPFQCNRLTIKFEDGDEVGQDVRWEL